MKLAPIILFVYNRLSHTNLTIESLKANILADQSDLIIFSDAPKDEAQVSAVNEVRDYISQIAGFKSVKIIERNENLGLAKSIIEGVTSIVNKYGKVIVLEDDLVTSPYFLQFMNDGLNVYENNDDVASVEGYFYGIEDLPETFFLKGTGCWGWATWKDKWQMFEEDGAKLLTKLKEKKLINRFNFYGAYNFSKMLENQVSGKNNSWAVRWYASTFLKNKYTLYPGKSLVLNIGNDGSGTHCGKTSSFDSDLIYRPIKVIPIVVEDNIKVLHLTETFLKKLKPNIFVTCKLLLGKYYRKINK